MDKENHLLEAIKNPTDNYIEVRDLINNFVNHFYDDFNTSPISTLNKNSKAYIDIQYQAITKYKYNLEKIINMEFHINQLIIFKYDK